MKTLISLIVCLITIDLFAQTNNLEYYSEPATTITDSFKNESVIFYSFLCRAIHPINETGCPSIFTGDPS